MLRRFSFCRLPAARLGACCFLRGIFAFLSLSGVAAHFTVSRWNLNAVCTIVHAYTRARTHTQPHAHGAESAECVLSLYFSLPELLGAFFNKKRKKRIQRRARFQKRGADVSTAGSLCSPSSSSSSSGLRVDSFHHPLLSISASYVDRCVSVSQSESPGRAAVVVFFRPWIKMCA